jgi:hypothetical protein
MELKTCGVRNTGLLKCVRLDRHTQKPRLFPRCCIVVVTAFYKIFYTTHDGRQGPETQQQDVDQSERNAVIEEVSIFHSDENF